MHSITDNTIFVCTNQILVLCEIGRQLKTLYILAQNRCGYTVYFMQMNLVAQHELHLLIPSGVLYLFGWHFPWWSNFTS